MMARVSRRWPEAHAICERCGRRVNHNDLQWQFEWRGPRLQNLRKLVCRTCLDVPQQQLRTIILPQDPVPIQNPRPEPYDLDNNPNSPIGHSGVTYLAGSNIGTLVGGAGTYSAFDGATNKSFGQSANLLVSRAGFGNWVGKDWNANLTGGLLSSSSPVQYIARSFTATAPNNATFFGIAVTADNTSITADNAFITVDAVNPVTDYIFQGSNDGYSWHTLSSGRTTGIIGEVISDDTLPDLAYRFHRFAVEGDGATPVGIAQLAIDTDRGTVSPDISVQITADNSFITADTTIFAADGSGP